MTRLNIDNDKPALVTADGDPVALADRRVSLGRVITYIFAILGWLWALLGSGTGVVAKDYVSVRDRVTTLETQRVEDLRAQSRRDQDDREWRAAVDRKLDAVISRLPRVR